MFCKQCGNSLTDEDLYCPNCGCKNVSLSVCTSNIDKEANSLKAFYQANKKPLLIIGFIFVIVLIVGGYRIHKTNEYNRMWKEYKISQKDSSSSNKGNSSSLHKYENSTYKIGTDMPAGEYVLFANSGAGYFCLSSDSSGDSIISNDNFEYNSIIRVNSGEYLKLSRCYAEPIGSAGTVSTSGSGMFKIGVHLKAGEYKLESTSSSGYYCVYSDDRQDCIVTNDNFDGNTYVTVRDGQYLLLSRCRIVK